VYYYGKRSIKRKKKMSEFDILFPMPDGKRNADDMGMPKESKEPDVNADEWDIDPSKACALDDPECEACQ